MRRVLAQRLPRGLCAMAYFDPAAALLFNCIPSLRLLNNHRRNRVRPEITPRMAPQ